MAKAKKQDKPEAQTEQLGEEQVSSEQEATTVSQSSKSLVLSTGAIQYMSSGDEPRVDKSLVNVEIHYPAEYPKKKRYHKEGGVYPMSAESAKIIVDKGIGKIV